MTRTDLINQLIARQDYRSHLEIGLGDGAHFRAVRCREKESVAPGGPECPHASPHPLTSDDFFASNQRRYDLIFIDGLHRLPDRRPRPPARSGVSAPPLNSSTARARGLLPKS